MSDSLHQYRTPVPGGSSVSFSYYASNDFLVFVPDIPYKIGYPGESSENAVLPALSKLIDTGFVDENAIGVQGHSWGGYQIAHLVTRTNMFTAAISGAPVSNMVSAYGGIRWSSGMSRMFQYERTQSRLGGTLWEVPMRFLENSPIFYIDKVETPVLILHNDEDGAVPWYQGIELFVALRRLGKPGWLLNYNGEAHGLRKYPNRRDYALRMSQFFEHYLKGAPAPVWMVEGIPATKKGLTLGLELVGAGELAELGAE
jgi:dipeptidyl aminopeptidase/acylaminoacyl peptidase